MFDGELEQFGRAMRGTDPSEEELQEFIEAFSTGQLDQESWYPGAWRNTQLLYRLCDLLGQRLVSKKGRLTLRQVEKEYSFVKSAQDFLESINQLRVYSIPPYVVLDQERGEPLDALELRIFEVWIQEHFSRQFLAALPDFTRRWRNLQPVISDTDIPELAGEYFAEAANAYIYGLFRASALLSRSTLEDALRHRLTNERDGSVADLTLVELIGESKKRGLLPSEALAAAQRVRKMGNGIAHPSAQVSEHSAYRCLMDLVAVLRAVC